VQDPRAGRGDVDARVGDLRDAIRRSCAKGEGEPWDAANERHVEEFVESLKGRFPGRCFEVTRRAAPGPFDVEDGGRWESARRSVRPCVVVERQRLPRSAVRTTRLNYLFTVPGEAEDRVVLVAHYDTWGGPGADDNTTGEEILKQYLLSDLRADERPALTRTYFLAASEECGLAGLGSQLLLALGLVAANLALSQRDWTYAAVALALSPFAAYRFGVTGSREYVRSLSAPDLGRIRAVVAVDSVGEGRLYIPRATLGADFIRAVIPFGDYDSLDDLLEEAAHVNGIKYNSYLAGGTTDHLSFLEVNNGLVARAREGLASALACLRGRRHVPPLRVPAAALVAMAPGKASPLVFGGKLHTRRDVPERLDPRPLREALLVLDYVLDRLDGEPRPRAPRRLDEYHYARLYRGGSGEYLVLKDAIEPNRRNLNAVYRVAATVEGRRATARVRECVGWGVETRLRDQATAAIGGRLARVPVEELEVTGEALTLRFARRRTARHFVERVVRRALAAVERAMGRYSFLAFFASAWAIAEAVGRGLAALFAVAPGLGLWFFDHALLTVPLLMALQVGAVLCLISRLIPTWIDNAYRHESRADNLGSLRRVAARL
jgi:Peptidase family M28